MTSQQHHSLVDGLIAIVQQKIQYVQAAIITERRQKDKPGLSSRRIAIHDNDIARLGAEEKKLDDILAKHKAFKTRIETYFTAKDNHSVHVDSGYGTRKDKTLDANFKSDEEKYAKEVKKLWKEHKKIQSGGKKVGKKRRHGQCERIGEMITEGAAYIAAVV